MIGGPRRGLQGPEGAPRGLTGLQRCNKGPDVASALGPKGAHKAPKEPVGTDVPKGLKLIPCDQNSTGSDIGHVISSSEGPEGARRAPVGPAGPQRSPSELMDRRGSS